VLILKQPPEAWENGKNTEPGNITIPREVTSLLKQQQFDVRIFIAWCDTYSRPGQGG